MVFNSAEFLLFLPLVVLACYLVPRRLKNLWLLLASYFFYLCWNPAHLPVLLFVTAVAYGTGRLLGVARHPKGVLAAGVVLALAPLVGFKYLAFLVDSALAATARFGVVFAPPVFDWLLPLGISFYTLQAVGYMVDVYRGEPPEKSPLRMALFVAFFPQIVSGPIGRSKSLLAQFRLPQKPRFDDLREGALLMIWGYFLKVVIADRAAIFVDTVYCLDNGFEGWYLIVATVLFGVQLYCDFSGCTTVALGAARLLGVELIDNFNAPYLSRSTAEFWRRWHISLSTWFRDYLYIPLGGNRKGKLRKYGNVLITFAVSGLWHGAQWSFFAWGLLNGLYQVVGDLLRPLRQGLLRVAALDTDTLGHKLTQVLLTWVCINFSWVFFRADRFADALVIVQSIFTAANIQVLFDGSLYTCGVDATNFRLLLVYIAVLCGADLCKYKGISLRGVIARQNWLCQVLVVAGGVLAILLLGVYGPGFEASNFIYSQF